MPLSGFFFQAEDGIRDKLVTGVQTCALPICFPEIMFNLFPGMGAYSFLERKVGKRPTENLITSGKIYSADDMLAMGEVDVVVDQGRGEAEIAGFIRSRGRSRNAMVGISAARRRVHKLDYE